MRGMPVYRNMGGSRRKVFNKGRDKRGFSASGGMTHVLNSRAMPMRGGYRL